MNRKDIIIDYLNSLEISPKYKGYDYLIYGLELLLEREELLLCLSKGLYYEIAKNFDSTVSNVERNIRTIKQNLWEKDKDCIIFKDIAYYPTNGEFIDSIFYQIEEKIKNEPVSP